MRSRPIGDRNVARTRRVIITAIVMYSVPFGEMMFIIVTEGGGRCDGRHTECAHHVEEHVPLLRA